MKVKINISLDKEILDLAREDYLNISGYCNHALKLKLLKGIELPNE